MEVFLEFWFDGVVAAGAVFPGEVGVDLRVEGPVGGVDDAGGGPGFALVIEKVAEVRGDIGMMAHRHFVEEGGADDIDMGCGGDAAGEQVDGVGPVGFVEALGVVSEVKFIPEIATLDSGVFELGEGCFLGVDVVDGEKGGDTEFFGLGGDEAGHPIVAVDDVGFDARDDVIDEVALEGKGGHEEVFLAGLVNAAPAIEFAVFGEVDAIADRDPGAFSGMGDLLAFLEEIAVVGDGEVNVFFGGAETVDKEGGDVGESSGFGPESFGIFREFFGDVGDFGSDEEDPGTRVGGLFSSGFFGHGLGGRGERKDRWF